jgi:hypothetical protein
MVFIWFLEKTVIISLNNQSSLIPVVFFAVRTEFFTRISAAKGCDCDRLTLIPSEPLIQLKAVCFVTRNIMDVTVMLCDELFKKLKCDFRLSINGFRIRVNQRRNSSVWVIGRRKRHAVCRCRFLSFLLSLVQRTPKSVWNLGSSSSNPY